MERRWSPRTKAVMDVDLLFKGKRVERCHTRDIGMSGVFVEMARVALHKGVKVTLIFMLTGMEWPKKHPIKARVVRIEEGGIGLRFRDHDIGAFRSLQSVLRHVHGDTG